jgi:hypothetical protein
MVGGLDAHPTRRLYLQIPLLRAPAACWCARAIVESTLTSQVIIPFASALACRSLRIRAHVPLSQPGEDDLSLLLANPGGVGMTPDPATCGQALAAEPEQQREERRRHRPIAARGMLLLALAAVGITVIVAVKVVYGAGSPHHATAAPGPENKAATAPLSSATAPAGPATTAPVSLAPGSPTPHVTAPARSAAPPSVGQPARPSGTRPTDATQPKPPPRPRPKPSQKLCPVKDPANGLVIGWKPC